MNFMIVHNCLDMAVTSMMCHCKYINKFVILLGKSDVVNVLNLSGFHRYLSI